MKIDARRGAGPVAAGTPARPAARRAGSCAAGAATRWTPPGAPGVARRRPRLARDIPSAGRDDPGGQEPDIAGRARRPAGSSVRPAPPGRRSPSKDPGDAAAAAAPSPSGCTGVATISTP